MRAGDTQARDVLRSLITALKNEAIAQRIDVSELPEDVVIAVLRRAQKQRAEAARQYADSGATDRAEAESAEAEIIARYLPQQMSDEEIRGVVERVLNDIQEDAPSFGSVMGRVMQECGARADGARVTGIVRELLASR